MLPRIIVSQDDSIDQQIADLQSHLQIHPSHIFIVKPEKDFLIEHAHEIRSYISQTRPSEMYMIVMHNFHTAKPVSQNALLKTLEEDSSHIQFLMHVSHESAVISTIRSRAQTFYTKSEEHPTLNLKQFGLSLEDTLPQWLSKTTKIAKADALSTLDSLVTEVRKKMKSESENLQRYVTALRSLIQLRKAMKENNLYYEYALDAAGFILNKNSLLRDTF